MVEKGYSPGERPRSFAAKGSSESRGESQSLRLLFVGNFFLVHGVAAGYCHQMSDRLEAAGHTVIRTSHFKSRPVRLFDMMGTILKRRRDYEVAHVDVFSGPSLLWAATASTLLRFLRKPFVLSLRGGNLPEFSSRHGRWMRQLLAAATVVTAPSRYLIEKLQSSRSDILWIPNAVDCQQFSFRDRLGLKPRLVWVRAFHAIYAPGTALEVLAQVLRSEPTATLTMVGQDKDGSLAQCHERAAQLGVHERVHFVSGAARPRIPEYLDAADIFLNTARIDNTPLSVLEAMACGLCVVSNNVGGIPYLIEDGVDGILVPPGNAAAMAGAITGLLTEPERARRLASNARRKAEKFGWDNVLPSWEGLLAGCSREQAPGRRRWGQSAVR